MESVYMYGKSLAAVYGTALLSYLSMGDGIQWFRKVKKPAFEPPEWLFGVVWPILYTFQGIVGVELFARRDLAMLFGVQLLLSSIWTWLFFRHKEVNLAFLDLISCLAINIALTLELVLMQSWWSVGMMSAYCLWLMYASLLNGWFVVHGIQGNVPPI